MKHFLQQNTSNTLLKTSLGLILFFLVIQQGFGQQCVQCNGTTTSGTYPSAIGGSTTATGNYSLAGGLLSSAKGDASFAFGNRVEVDGTSSVGIGQFVRTNGLTSAIIGAGFDINYPLINTNEFSLVIGFKSTKPTFFVGKSTGVNNTGKIGIGNVTDPQAKLHIRADATEEASMRLEPTGTAYNAVVYFTNSGHAVKAKTGGHLTFSTQSTKGFVFEAGNVGIGINDPSAKLHIADGDVYIEDIDHGIIMKSPNGQCWRGTLNDQGTLNFSQTTCPEGTSTSAQSHNSEKLMLVYPNPASHSLSVETRLNGRQGTLAVLSTAGFRLSEQPVNTGKTYVQLETYAAGTYFLQLEIDGKVAESTKFVKK